MKKIKNLASLPRHEALAAARNAGRAVLADSKAVSSVCLTLWTEWMQANIPRACGQSDDEFGQLLSDMMEEFDVGLDEFIESASSRHAPPAPIDGEHAASGALLLLEALKWVNAEAQDDAGIEAMQTILDLALPELGMRIETARRAVSACR
jgi:hypothetical protein